MAQRDRDMATMAGGLADLLEVSEVQAAAVEAFGRLLAEQAASALSFALGQPVRIGPALVRQIEPGDIESEHWDSYHPIDVRWEAGGVTYAPLLLLPKEHLPTLLPTARGAGELPDLEALGQLLRNLAEHLSAEIERAFTPAVRFSLPEAGAVPHNEQEVLVRVEHTVAAGHPGGETELTVIHLVPVAALRALSLRHGATQEAVEASFAAPPPPAPSREQSAAATGMSGATTTEETMTSATQPAGTSVHPVQFQPFDHETGVRGATNLDLLLDVSLRVSVELGRADLTIKEVLALGPGSVVELDKLAGEPVDILVNDRLIARGEVVVVDENFGVRVTDIESPQRRVARMR